MSAGMPVDLEALEVLAVADPGGPAALRLAWLNARASGVSRSHLIELVRICHERNFSIPEIHAYVAEQLASAREGLEMARKSGRVSEATLSDLEHLIRSGETAEKVRQDLVKHPDLVLALEAADDLAKRPRSSRSPEPTMASDGSAIGDDLSTVRILRGPTNCIVLGRRKEATNP